MSTATSTASGHVATVQVVYSATVPETISFNDNLTAGALPRCTLCVSLTEKESHEIIVQIFGVPSWGPYPRVLRPRRKADAVPRDLMCVGFTEVSDTPGTRPIRRLIDQALEPHGPLRTCVFISDLSGGERPYATSVDSAQDRPAADVTVPGGPGTFMR